MKMYFIAIVCPESINSKVLEWKLWMKEQHGCVIALRSPAHITLVPPFWMKSESEILLVNSLARFAAPQPTFDVHLKNFSNFKPRVIFIDVLPNAELTGLQNDLVDGLLSENAYPLKKEERPFHPHVTIATRDLYKKSFYEAWETFKHKTYEATWRVNAISLLAHNKKNWDVIATSQFQ
jgi:2'-5' RNA ligase